MNDDLRRRLRIHFGLSFMPHDAQIARWLDQVSEAVAAGAQEPEAARSSALIAFGELDRQILLSQADTIVALLEMARQYRTAQEELPVTEIGAALRIKYRLRDVPSDRDAEVWARRVDDLRSDGFGDEEAGHKAADELFEIVPDLILKSEADTIAVLLELARRK